MKILYQSPSQIPSQTANSVHVMNIADEFAKMGNETKLLALDGNTEIQQSDYEYYGVENNFEIKKIGSTTKLGKIKFILLSLITAFNFKPDLIVTRFPPGAYVFLLFGFKVVLDAHHPVWHGSKFKYYLYNFFRKNKNLKRITTNSKSLKDMFFEENMQPSCEIVVAHNGSKVFNRDNTLNLKSNTDMNVGYIGSVCDGRGVDIIIKTANELENISFHIAGGNESEIKELKENYVIPENIIFHGYIDPAKVYMFRNSCDILLAPYYRSGVMIKNSTEDSSKYMNPIKIIEYMSSGKPIIASDLAQIREVLNDNIALLVNPENISEWVDAIKKIVIDTNLYQNIEKNSYNYFLENYSWKKRALKLLGIK